MAEGLAKEVKVLRNDAEFDSERPECSEYDAHEAVGRGPWRMAVQSMVWLREALSQVPQ